MLEGGEEEGRGRERRGERDEVEKGRDKGQSQRMLHIMASEEKETKQITRFHRHKIAEPEKASLQVAEWAGPEPQQR